MNNLFQGPWNDDVGSIGEGLLRILGYTIASFTGATILGLLIALMRSNRSALVRVPAAFDMEPLDVLLTNVRRIFPDLGAPARSWMGFRPSMPDSVPVIRPPWVARMSSSPSGMGTSD